MANHRGIECNTCRHWLCDYYCGGDGYDPSIIKLLRKKIRKCIIKKLRLQEETT